MKSATQERIRMVELQMAQRRWVNLNIREKVEMIARHYVTHAVLFQQILRMVECPSRYNEDTEFMVKQMLNLVITNHEHSFGNVPAWNH